MSAKNEPPDAIKIEIARYFNVSVDYLLGLTDVPTPLNRRQGILRLPAGFPREALPDLLLYAAFLTDRSERQKAAGAE